MRTKEWQLVFVIFSSEANFKNSLIFFPFHKVYLPFSAARSMLSRILRYVSFYFQAFIFKRSSSSVHFSSFQPRWRGLSMNGSTIHCQRCFFHGFRQCGVRMHGSSNVLRTCSVFHRKHNFSNQFRGLRTNHMDT